MRKLFIALALALVLLVPGIPAPTRAGTFEFEVPAPFILYFEGSLAALTGFGCYGAGGPTFPWIAIQQQTETEVVAFLGETAKTKDNATKEKVKSKDAAKNAASGEITRIDETDIPNKAGPRGFDYVFTDVKAKMRAKLTYVTDPEVKADLVGTGGKATVKDATNKFKLAAVAAGALKSTDPKAACTVTLDTERRPVGLRASGLPGGETLNLHLGR